MFPYASIDFVFTYKDDSRTKYMIFEEKHSPPIKLTLFEMNNNYTYKQRTYFYKNLLFCTWNAINKKVHCKRSHRLILNS